MNKRFKYLLIISVLLVLFLENNYSQNKKDNFIVVLDAGHGERIQETEVMVITKKK